MEPIKILISFLLFKILYERHLASSDITEGVDVILIKRFIQYLFIVLIIGLFGSFSTKSIDGISAISSIVNVIMSSYKVIFMRILVLSSILFLSPNYL
jgi:hypothetical protein